MTGFSPEIAQNRRNLVSSSGVHPQATHYKVASGISFMSCWVENIERIQAFMVCLSKSGDGVGNWLTTPLLPVLGAEARRIPQILAKLPSGSSNVLAANGALLTECGRQACLPSPAGLVLSAGAPGCYTETV